MMEMEPSDEELVAACLEGEREEYARLLERHQDAVFNLAYRMTGNGTEAADLAQEAFIRAYRRLSTYQPGRSFRNWVMGICANLARNRFRSLSRQRLMEEKYALEVAVESSAAEAGRDPRHELLERALMQLPSKIRMPLVLKYMEGMTGEEIAGVLNLGVGAVKMRLLRAREVLLRIMSTGMEDT